MEKSGEATKKLWEILSDPNLNYNEDELYNTVKAIAEFYSGHQRHQYHIISRYVDEKLKDPGGEEAISYILFKLNLLIDFTKGKEDIIIQKMTLWNLEIPVDELTLDLEKMFDHIALEEERIKANSRSLDEARSKIRIEFSEQVNPVLKEFKQNVEETKQTLNSNIIAIVGLFSAIIFVFFGGVQSISGLISGMEGIKNKTELDFILVLIFVAGLVVFNVVFLLLYSISKIIDKNIGTKIKEPQVPCSICRKIRRIIKKVLFRFPYVLIVNIIFLIGIWVFYRQIS